MASWDDLKRPTRQLHARSDSDDYAELCAVVFASPNGRRLLQMLHEKYIDDVILTVVHKSALLQHNAKRQLVRELERKTEEGLALMKSIAEKVT